jgi:hypothetical protein
MHGHVNVKSGGQIKGDRSPQKKIKRKGGVGWQGENEGNRLKVNYLLLNLIYLRIVDTV